MAATKRWIPLAIATALILALAASVVIEGSQVQAARSQLTAVNAAASAQTVELANVKQQLQTLETQNSNLSGVVTSLTGQVASLMKLNATLSSQIATLRAQFPPPTSCTADPGFRSNVNQQSLQIVGLSTTQKLVNYLCQKGYIDPGSVRLFFESTPLNYLQKNFGYG